MTAVRAFRVTRHGQRWLIDVADGDGWRAFRTGEGSTGLQRYVGGERQWALVDPAVRWPEHRSAMRAAFRAWLAAEEESSDGRHQLAVGTHPGQ